jgi:hypothetical protein
MEAAEPWDCCDLTDCLRWSADWSILIECKVLSYAVVICLVIGDQMANMPLPQRHDMIEALASDRSDQPFNMTVLTRRAWGDRPISDAHGSQPAGDRNTIARVTIADEVARRVVPQECSSTLDATTARLLTAGHKVAVSEQASELLVAGFPPLLFVRKFRAL